MKPKYPHIRVKLTGQDDNAFFILGAVSQTMRKHKVPEKEIDIFRQEAISGDYDNLLATCMKWVECD